MFLGRHLGKILGMKKLLKNFIKVRLDCFKGKMNRVEQKFLACKKVSLVFDWRVSREFVAKVVDFLFLVKRFSELCLSN
jgi:hypothetical protein